MTWDIAASIAEVVGAIAVVVSLVYLAVQVKLNTKAEQANAYELAVQSEMEVAIVLVDHADTWEKVIGGEEIADRAERRAAILLYNLLMLDTERRYQQFARGYLSPQPWEARRRALPRLVSLPIFRAWRDSLGAQGHSAEFLQLVDEVAMLRERNAGAV